jgi:hypothetical protein
LRILLVEDDSLLGDGIRAGLRVLKDLRSTPTGRIRLV